MQDLLQKTMLSALMWSYDVFWWKLLNMGSNIFLKVQVTFSYMLKKTHHTRTMTTRYLVSLIITMSGLYIMILIVK